MSSKDKNLSSSSSDKDISDKSVGIVWSRWNEDITSSLRDACIKTLKKNGLQDDSLTVIEVPGAFELPYGAKLLFCLLYTSPSPRDKRQSRMPSSA